MPSATPPGSYDSKNKPHRDLRGARGFTLPGLAEEWAERLVRSSLEQEERIVVRDVEDVQRGFEAAGAKPEVLPDPQVHAPDRPSANWPSLRVALAKRIVVASGFETTRPLESVTVDGPKRGSGAVKRVRMGPDQTPDWYV